MSIMGDRLHGWQLVTNAPLTLKGQAQEGENNNKDITNTIQDLGKEKSFLFWHKYIYIYIYIYTHIKQACVMHTHTHMHTHMKQEVNDILFHVAVVAIYINSFKM